MFLKCSLMIYKQTVKMLHINLIACAVNVGMNVILLPRIGLLGAALATLGSYAVMTVLFAHYAQQSLPLSMDWVAWLKYSAVGLLSWLLVSRLEINNFFFSLLVRGTLSMLVYFGILYLTDARTRELTSLAFRTLSRALGQKPAHSEGSAA
jgi:O-antigen/teichoic acid export membrane protein